MGLRQPEKMRLTQNLAQVFIKIYDLLMRR
jgi:hypothetical protein